MREIVLLKSRLDKQGGAEKYTWRLSDAFLKQHCAVTLLTSGALPPQKLKPHLNTIRIVSGVFLVFIGLFILLGRLQRMNIFLFRLAGNLDQWGQNAPLHVQLFFGLLFILPALLLAFFYLKKAIAEKKYPFKPLRFAFFLTFLLISVLSFAGVITPSRFFTFWLTFQGI